MPKTITITSHEERKTRRRQMADFVNSRCGDITDILNEAAEKFRVTPETIRRACSEYNVDLHDKRYTRKLPSNTDLNDTVYRVLALMVNENLEDASIAKKVGVTKQRVNVIRQKARTAGIPFGVGGIVASKKPKRSVKI